ncbi:lysM and putative peptidoglycan-binding domain-containing protein 4 [Toxorhynchites rutilus septentrionalis]|uniref:lysM and putative peptidoglycan-binding domain-containing protein 4 n=1 Tax=Toxorhynchites rutilus septentrionalis TaxID=329112 RepID=UPI00247B1AF6|nr:lysM and putative peptidoglycan-binding domain-containing protein 4 [Toxorhynchites rutilus septentrionalis]
MKRQRVKHTPNHVYVESQLETNDCLPLNETKQNPSEKWLEAQVLPGDTLQAVALRYNCTIAELKKLNKIDKENEIYARKIIKVPITPHSILLETLPKVHSSGSSSPKNIPDVSRSFASVLEKQTNLDEKLIVAAVSSASYKNDSVKDAATHSKHLDETYTDLETLSNDETLSRQPLLSGEYDENLPLPRPLRLPASDFSCNGSDCDISWICLLVFILALCFAIPLIYVIYVAEHIENYHHENIVNETISHKT